MGRDIPVDLLDHLAVVADLFLRCVRCPVQFSDFVFIFPDIRLDGFGNLVALPLQGKARKDLNSVFVDDEFFAYRDQWTYLAQVQKIEEQKVDVIL